ncbi:class I SAM-dependent methyltransferase [Nostoc sp.]|uniref:class I SAM-dependent methyltransferase n=1 Tax=Nostoc sp. TaxID=1180 RepID=UPI002FF542F1
MRLENMSNNLEERYSSNGAKYLAQHKYSEAIAFYKKSIETDPTLMSNYWYLCLALLLQEQKSEAMAIWLSILEKADIEKVNTWTLDLVEVLTAEAIRYKGVLDFESARKMYGYVAIARSEAWKKVKGYKFTEDWFSQNLPIWEEYLIHLANKPEINILEIGSWEGMSACWLLDHILTHKSSRITCIDTFEGSIEHKLEYNDSYIKSVEEKFDFNISQTGVSEKVTKIVGSSQHVMRSLPLKSYDMLYIDGSHLASDVLTDAVLGWGLVKIGGLIVFDDYDFKFPNSVDAGQETKIGIDAFLKVFCKKINIIHQGHQVIVEKGVIA